MRVPPHPHIGLQAASWLFDGAVLHRDSLGTEQLIRPGELNLMTSERGIAHSEESPAVRPGLLHGVQLWIALPVRASSTGCSPRTAPRVSAARRSPAPPPASSRECSRIFR